MCKLDALITSSISNFEEALKKYDYIEKDLSQVEIEIIKRQIEEHADCLDIWDNDTEVCDHPMIEIVVYGKGQNIALECMNCNEVIIDSEYFKKED